VATETPDQIAEIERGGRLEVYRLTADPLIALIGAFYLVLLLIPHTVITSWNSARLILLLDVVFWGVITCDVAYRSWLAPTLRQRLPSLVMLGLLLTGPFVFLAIREDARDLIRIALIAVVSLRAIESVRYFFRLRSILYIVSAVVLIIIVAAVLVTSVEHDARRANITSLGTGVWWAVVTISSVGYGDTYPVTDAGRVIGTGLMFFGVAMFSILTATLAHSFAKREEQSPTGEFATLHERLERIEQNQLRRQPVRRTRAPRRPHRTTAPPRIGGMPDDKE